MTGVVSVISFLFALIDKEGIDFCPLILYAVTLLKVSDSQVWLCLGTLNSQYTHEEISG